MSVLTDILDAVAETPFDDTGDPRTTHGMLAELFTDLHTVAVRVDVDQISRVIDNLGWAGSDLTARDRADLDDLRALTPQVSFTTAQVPLPVSYDLTARGVIRCDQPLGTLQRYHRCLVTPPGTTQVLDLRADPLAALADLSGDLLLGIVADQAQLLAQGGEVTLQEAHTRTLATVAPSCSGLTMKTQVRNRLLSDRLYGAPDAEAISALFGVAEQWRWGPDWDAHDDVFTRTLNTRTLVNLVTAHRLTVEGGGRVLAVLGGTRLLVTAPEEDALAGLRTWARAHCPGRIFDWH